jgi:polysaccharide biosynthesis protein PslG
LSICKQQRILVVVCCALFALLAPGAASSASHPLVTGVEQPDTNTTDLQNAYGRIRGTGARVVRIIVYWNSVEPSHGSFKWTEPDKQIGNALSQGLDPLVTVWRAPAWAENGSTGDPGTRKPSPAAFGSFAHALASRYPQVHRWEAWNEPNEPHFLQPQRPAFYRQLLNAFSDGVHGVDPNDSVAGGGLSPRFRIAPLAFMRGLFCLTASNQRARSCPVHLDAWSHHPYTNGGPFTKQGTPDGVSLGDLKRMHRTLRAAARAGNVRTNNGSVQFWVSEFSWDSDGPDPHAVPMRLLTRWVAEALHQSYVAGVSIFVWHQLRDRPITQSPYQSGFYFCGSPGTADDNPSDSSYCRDGAVLDRDAPKTSSIRAFRFPFVAYAKKGRVRVWGRTPDAAAHRVTIKRKVSGSWKTVKRLKANGRGIFSSSWRSGDATHLYEALASGSQSVPFSLKKPKPFRFDMSMWGCGGFIAC